MGGRGSAALPLGLQWRWAGQFLLQLGLSVALDAQCFPQQTPCQHHLAHPTHPLSPPPHPIPSHAPPPLVQSALAAFGVARATNAGQLTVANVFTSLALLALPKLYMCDFFVMGVSGCCILVGSISAAAG